MSSSKKYVFTEYADTQIQEIMQYSIKAFDYKVAHDYLSGLKNTFEMLAENPEIGRNYASAEKGIRRHEHKSHVIFYKMQQNQILIGGVFHFRQIPKIKF